MSLLQYLKQIMFLHNKYKINSFMLFEHWKFYVDAIIGIMKVGMYIFDKWFESSKLGAVYKPRLTQLA